LTNTSPPFGVEACAKIVAPTTRACQLPSATSTIPEPQHFDALAASFGALSLALTVGAIVIAVLVAIAGFAWGRSIAREAKEEAVKAVREEVARVAEGIMDDWLSTKGLESLRQARQLSDPPTLPTAGADIADSIAENAGDDP
jgi:hypothetical protein